jgi:hypothetical protein
MARRARSDVNLLRLADLLQAHITPALCHAAFGRVRKTERQRVWTLTALVQFWVAVILRAPRALSQALADGLEVREPLFPRVPEWRFSRSASAILGWRYMDIDLHKRRVIEDVSLNGPFLAVNFHF